MNALDLVEGRNVVDKRRVRRGDDLNEGRAVHGDEGLRESGLCRSRLMDPEDLGSASLFTSHSNGSSAWTGML